MLEITRKCINKCGKEYTNFYNPACSFECWNSHFNNGTQHSIFMECLVTTCGYRGMYFTKGKIYEIDIEYEYIEKGEYGTYYEVVDDKGKITKWFALSAFRFNTSVILNSVFLPYDHKGDIKEMNLYINKRSKTKY